MSEDDKAPAMTIRIPAPRVLAEAAARRPDARTAEVLRALHRAKGTITVQRDPGLGTARVARVVVEDVAGRRGDSTASRLVRRTLPAGRDHA
jgi:hypothetical protein